MRLGILIKDAEYREALVQKLSYYDNDIFVNVIGNKVSTDSDSLILTDIPPSSLDIKVLKAIMPRTVFIMTSYEDVPEGCNTVFKYCSIPEIISELSLVYNSLHGKVRGIDHTAKLIAVCCESDSYAAERCRSLAGQIIYQRGGSVLILPLSYINDYGFPDAAGRNGLSRLLYSIRSGRASSIDSVTYTDSYGISAMLLAHGRNPIAYLDEEELHTLIFGLSRRFDTIIADAGTCFREENIAVIKEADSIVLFERGRRITEIDEMIGSDADQKLIKVKVTGGTEDAVSMDDCVKRIYGADRNESIKGRDNKEVRK